MTGGGMTQKRCRPAVCGAPRRGWTARTLLTRVHRFRSAHALGVRGAQGAGPAASCTVWYASNKGPLAPSPKPECLLAVHKNNNFKGSIYMVFDYAEYDLTGLMESQKYSFTEPQVRDVGAITHVLLVPDLVSVSPRATHLIACRSSAS